MYKATDESYRDPAFSRLTLYLLIFLQRSNNTIKLPFKSIIPRLINVKTPTLSQKTINSSNSKRIINYSTMVHPQRAIHKMSLLNNSEDSTIHPSTDLVKSGAHGSADAQSFWLNAAKDIDWFVEPKIAHDGKNWFPSATLNTCYNALDRHVQNGYGDRPCFHHYSPLPAAVAHPERTMTYTEVLRATQVLAGVMRHKLGVKKGDTVVIYVSLRSIRREKMRKIEQTG